MISTLKPYLAMKDPGLPWLGRLPGPWAVQRLGNAVDMRVSNVDKLSKEGEFPVRLCNYTDVYKHDRLRDDMPFMRATASPEEASRFRLERGDVLITKDSETWNDIGVPALVETPADDLICGYHLALLRPRRDRLLGGYLFRALQSTGLAYQFHVEANGVTRYGLSHAAIKSVWLPLPPLPEQHAIVRFLDHADRRIRRYIRAKQQLIKLLEEQKQAIIHRAVTRGLDPDVRLKPSGVEWLGEVPEHWEVTRLKARLARNDAGAWGADFADNGTIVLRSTEQTVDGGWRIDNPARRALSEKERKSTQLLAGDLVVTKSSGSAAHIGKTSLVTPEIEALACGFSNFMQRLRPKQTAHPQFLWYCLNCRLGREQLVYYSSTTTGLGNLSGTILGNLRIAFPRTGEQEAICLEIAFRTQKQQSAIDAAYEEVRLIREFRTRLIADVVTGKVDVREAAASLQDEGMEVEPLDEAGPLVEIGEDGPDALDAIPEEAEV